MLYLLKKIVNQLRLGPQKKLMLNQRTIKRAITIEGKGLHTGCPVTIFIKPAPENYGVVFKRRDIGNIQIRANFANVLSTNLATTLCEN